MRSSYYIVKSLEEVKKVIQSCKETGYCCFDYETNAQPLYMHTFTPTLLSISFQAGSSVQIPLDHFERDKYTDGFDWKKALQMVGKELFQNLKVTKIAWNAKFDDQINKKFGIQCKGTLLDGMLAKYILNEEKPNGLKEMVARYLPGFAGYQKENNLDKMDWDKKPLDLLSKYAGMDTDCTLRLTLFFEKKLIDLGMYNILRNLYMPASRLLTEVESNGLYLDRGFNQQLLAEYEPKIQAARDTIYSLPRVQKFNGIYIQGKVQAYLDQLQRELDELDPDNPKDKRKISSRETKIANIRAGIFITQKEQDLIKPINLNSNKDLPALMYSKEGLNLPIIAYTQQNYKDTDKPSTAEDTLVELRLRIKKPDSPKAVFLDKLLELRGLEKMYKTYILGWSEKVQDDDCLHGRFLLHGCVTGDTLLVGKDRDIKIQDICPQEVGVKNVEKEDIWLLSQEGTWEQVTHTINKGLQPTYQITTQRGDILKCTKEHKLLTTRGWKTVREIYKKQLWVIGYDTSYLDFAKPQMGKASQEVVFREIPDWPGYLASSEGKVFSIKMPGGRGVLDYNHPHELVPRDWGNRGRLRVYLRKNNHKKYAFSVSHLVWMAFNNASFVPEGYVIDHIDCNPRNNQPSNLQCITYADNTKRSYYNTRSSFMGGSRNGITKFTTLKVGQIKEKGLEGYTQNKIQHLFDISQKQVSGILRGERRKNIFITKIRDYKYLGNQVIYDLSINKYHSYVTRSNYINSNTTSGRLSSAEPNMQQIPKTSVDPNIKKQLIAKPGQLYLVMDFSQAELRIMAHLSKDETYLKAFRENKDPHLAIAAQKYGVPYDEAEKIYGDENHPDYKLWKTRRKQAKQIAFGLIYGIQSKLLSVKLSDPKAGLIVTPEEAQQMMDDYFAEHPRIKKFMGSQERLLYKQGYIKSLFGTKRRLPGIYSENNADVAYAIRLAVNFPCQGAASHMTLFGAILNYWDMKRGYFPPMDEVCTVHDAVYYNTNPKYINLYTIWKLWDTFRNPKTKEYFNFQINDVDLSMDFSIGRNMAEELPFIPGYDYSKMLRDDFSVEAYMEEYHQYKDIPTKSFPEKFPELFQEGKNWKSL
nr:MAG TPA: DNA POLYMERASE [Caudoviricetes sp.]